jgi:hypothetical protein
MKWRDRLIVLASAIFGCGLLWTAGSRLAPLTQSRQEMGLVATTPLENAPPSLAFATVAMGAFRGLVVDVLWMRADRLKEKGQFFDAKQLAEWITTLQPRFAAVWDFHAWNMAYNISVAVPNTQWEERWQWVRNGYELLRDKAIPLNPKSILLYRSMAWIFQHKMGGIADDCHRHYKRELALAMRALLGDPETNDMFEKLNTAPTELAERLKDPGVAAFVAKLRAADKAFAEADDKTLVANYLALRQNPKKFDLKAFAVIDEFRGGEILDRFDLFARAFQLRHEWKMDIAFMQELNKRFGRTNISDPNNRQPLNWEHPNAHAIYWAELGLKLAGRPGQYIIDEKNTDRIVFHGLQSLYRQGDMIIYGAPGELPTVFLRPDLRMFESCNEAWKQDIVKYETLEKGNPKAVRGGHRNFLENAIELFYRAGHKQKAGEIYLQLRKEYSTGEHSGDYSMPLIEFVHARINEELDKISDKDATEQILMSLHEAYFQYAVRRDSEAESREAWAKEIYVLYQKKYGAQEQYRMGLPDFEMIRFAAFMAFMNDQNYPEVLRRNLLARIQLERPDLYKQLEEQKQVFRGLMEKQSQQPPAPGSN